MTNVKWTFPDQASGLTDYHSIPTEKALDSELETFVREVLQNANDQGLPNDDPVKVTFEFNRLTGDDLKDYLEALEWTGQTDPPANLEWHVERAIDNEQARDPGLKRFIDSFDGEELLVLTVHDENTTGLVGKEDDSSQPYGALVKDFGGSEKLDSSSGGSHGVGKTVLWAFSSISTVLFNSTPRDTPSAEREPPRLIGRSILPAHEHEDADRTYTNHGWFGYDDDSEIDRLGRPPSLWGREDTVSELAETLQVERPNEETGTSIGVVGFRIPGEDMHPDPEDLSEKFRHAAVKHFWPAISRGDLEIRIRTPDGAEEVADWDDAPGVRPFVECYSQLFDVDSDELEGPGSVAKTSVDITVPEESEGVIDTPDPEYKTTVDLLIRQLNPTDTEEFDESDDTDLSKNRVARLRGAQMIVDYVDKSSVADRGDDFVGVLVCGEAQSPNGDTPTPEQRAVEKFLKRSEPTQHDDWQGSKNDYLKKHYRGTIVKEIAALEGERLERALAEVVQEDIESGDEVPDMDDVAPIMGGRTNDDESKGGGPVMDWNVEPETWFDDENWSFYGKGGPIDEEHGPWSVTITIDRLDVDESSSDSIPVQSVKPLSPGVEMKYNGSSVTLKVDESIDEIEFEGSSEEVVDGIGDVREAFEVGAITEARLDVSAEIETEGDS
ncbi:hypothetical protein BV210_02585 [Halorientalis sp. IM1011]|uniref:hypothetical protein n=1 Tax=Halorientalis sp. IM1011 TaxID=1932360 RepID=UPI00097CD172|nr:hypothetical protein [Halorientalis sp. IM1011]AQL41668.1 hypothetical protein BV210_02585 [Halorientalis sp. IM1011]